MKRLLLLLMIVAVIITACMHIGRNTTESVGFTWYLYSRTHDVHKDDYVIFRAVDDPLSILPKNSKLVKKAACLSGMELVATDMAFICDGEYIAIRKDPERMKFTFTGKIPKGKLFVLGSHERSYDSRIWGLLDESNIIGTVYPLF